MRRRARTAALVALVGCQFPMPHEHGGGGGGGDAGTDAPGALCTVFAAEPSLVRAGDTLVIEGDFAALDSPVVVFPSGATHAGSAAGPDRVFVDVPANAGGGTVTVQQCAGGAPLRKLTFTPELGPVQAVDDQADGARQPPVLTEPRQAGTAAVGDGCVFAIDGIAATGFASVEAAPINADGTLGQFRSVGPSLDRAQAAAIVVNDQLYVVGGSAAGGIVTGPATVERATIGPGCALSAFSEPSAGGLVAPRVQPTVAVIGNRLYVAGGGATAIESASLEDTAFAFTSSAVAAVPRVGAVGAVIGDAWYLFGGIQSTGSVDFEALVIGADGALGQDMAGVVGGASWGSGTVGEVLGPIIVTFGGGSGTAATAVQTFLFTTNGFVLQPSSPPLPSPLAGALTPVVVGNFVYLLGGAAAGGSATAAVLRSPITAGATLGSGVASTSIELSTPRFDDGVTVIGDDISAIGGVSGSSTTLTSVEVASTAADGTPGSFGAGGGSLDPARAGFANATLDGDVYVFGGEATVGGAPNDTSADAAGGSGILAAFATGAGMSTARLGASAILTGDQIYVIAGLGAAGPVRGMDVGTVASGALAALSSTGSPTLAVARWQFGAAVVGNELYILGGCTAAAASSCRGAAVPGSIEAVPIAATGALGDGTVIAGKLMNTARFDAATAVLGEDVCSFGGTNSAGSALATFECDQFDGSGHLLGLAELGDLSTPRSGARAVVLGNNIYVIGGHDATGSALATVDVVPLQ